MTRIERKRFGRFRIRRTPRFRMARRKFRTLDEARRRGIFFRWKVLPLKSRAPLGTEEGVRGIRPESNSRGGADLAFFYLLPPAWQYARRRVRTRAEKRRFNSGIHRLRRLSCRALGHGGDLSHAETPSRSTSRARRNRIRARLFGLAFRRGNQGTLRMHGPRIRGSLLLLDIRSAFMVGRDHGRSSRDLFLHTGKTQKIICFRHFSFPMVPRCWQSRHRMPIRTSKPLANSEIGSENRTPCFS